MPPRRFICCGLKETGFGPTCRARRKGRERPAGNPTRTQTERRAQDPLDRNVNSTQRSLEMAQIAPMKLLKTSHQPTKPAIQSYWDNACGTKDAQEMSSSSDSEPTTWTVERLASHRDGARDSGTDPTQTVASVSQILPCYSTCCIRRCRPQANCATYVDARQDLPEDSGVFIQSVVGELVTVQAEEVGGLAQLQERTLEHVLHGPWTVFNAWCWDSTCCQRCQKCAPVVGESAKETPSTLTGMPMACSAHVSRTRHGNMSSGTGTWLLRLFTSLPMERLPR